MRRALLVVILAVAAGVGLFLWERSASSGARPAAVAPAGAEENDPTAPNRVKPTLAAAIVGEWRSVDDPSFTRVFEADGKFYDTYEGVADAPGTWAEVGGELHLSSGAGTLRFDVTGVTESSLAMIYLDRGNLLRFERAR